MKKLSYVCGAAKPLIAKTVGDVLRDTARRHPLAEACVFPKEGVRWSYAEFLQRSEEVAQGLLSLGLPRQSRIGVFTTNRSEFAISMFATALTGNILVSINPAYFERELENALNAVECSALIMSDGFKKTNFVEMIQRICPEIGKNYIGKLESQRCPSLKWVIKTADNPTPGILNFKDLYGHKASDFLDISHTIDPELPYNIQFTSGTTGKPKASVLTHHSLVNNEAFFAKHIKLSPKDRVCISVPLNHIFAMGVGLLAGVIQGSTVVVPDSWFSPVTTLNAIEAEQCTMVYGVPTMFQSILNEQETNPRKIDSLNKVAIAGSVAPPALMQRILTELKIEHLVNVYGMTETSSTSCHTHYKESEDKVLTTIGQPPPNIEAKIVNDRNQTVPLGSPGEICFRGFYVMKGYWGNEKATKEAIDENGWLHSGDIGIMDEDYYIKILDRKKDLIIRGGENIAPSEIEAIYSTHPGIEQIHVVGAPDEYYGEVVCAWVKMRTGHQPVTIEDLKKFGEGKIAYYKIPSLLRVVESFPLSPVGKILKKEMRDIEKQTAHLAKN